MKFTPGFWEATGTLPRNRRDLPRDKARRYQTAADLRNVIFEFPKLGAISLEVYDSLIGFSTLLRRRFQIKITAFSN